MKATGIICEYNPFHNGHLHHLIKSRSGQEDRYIVCVLSSNFLQRGEPALINKFARAKSAVLNGADLVIELPSVFSCSSAEFYAKSSVLLFQRLGLIDTLSFGSESGDLKKLKKIADLLTNETDEYKNILKENLSYGFSYPRARSLAVSEHMNDTEISQLIKSSNNILGIEYLKAMKLADSEFGPYTVKRVGSDYNDDTVSTKVPSATAIRRKFLHEGLESIKAYVPEPTYEILKCEFNEGIKPVTLESFRDIIFYRLSSLNKDQLLLYPFMSEGLENRLKKGISNSISVTELIDYCSTKRYPKTRISRALMHIVLDTKWYKYNEIMNMGPIYARILSASSRGEKLFSVLKKNSVIPFFTNLKGFYDKCSKSQRELLDLEIKSGNIYSSVSGMEHNYDFTYKFEI